MVDAARRACIAAGYRTACLTNNVVGRDDEPAAGAPDVDAVMARFDVVVESSKVGVRKPEPRVLRDGLRAARASTPAECVFLDDLGINLKPAAAMGMTTIKVVDPDASAALASTWSSSARQLRTQRL